MTGRAGCRAARRFSRRVPFGGAVQRFWALLGLGWLGPLPEFFYFPFQRSDPLAGARVAHDRRLAGVGLNLRSVHADRADPGQAQVLRPWEHAPERRLERGFVGRAKRAHRIGIGVGAQGTHRHVTAGGGFEGAGAETSGAEQSMSSARSRAGGYCSLPVPR